MSVISNLIKKELQTEVALTEKMINAFPQDKWDYKPHEKSMTAGQLISHLAEIPIWVTGTLAKDGMDVAGYETPKYENKEAAIAALKKACDDACSVCDSADYATYQEMWTMKNGGQEMFSMPKLDVLRNVVLGQLPHHRAQLGVYMRLLDEPVPATYGPSADNQS